MKIYTKTGDTGETSLFGGTRVSKANINVEAYGTVDELLSYIGLVRDFEVNAPFTDLLKEIQDRLFTIGSALAASPEKPHLKKPELIDTDIELLENTIDQLNEKIEPLKSFILPGGHVWVSQTHLARTVCRRAERICVAIHHSDPLDELIIKYLNRLSDFLFVLARYMSKQLNVEEIKWEPRK